MREPLQLNTDRLSPAASTRRGPVRELTLSPLTSAADRQPPSQAERPARNPLTTSSKEDLMNTTYTVSGMTCGHCVHAVKQEVSAIPGVTDVALALETGKLEITSSAPVDFDRIVEAVAEAGEHDSVS